MSGGGGKTALYALAYGVLGFGAGFVFGALREMVLIPRFGDELGRYIEFPLMIAALFVIALLLQRRLLLGSGALILAGIGGTVVLIVIESAFALFVMGQTTGEYLSSFDISQGALFPLGLLLMALMPWAVGKRS
ncbi:MAG: hypothetical protein H6883_01010 [Rhodobiaceae bacterium]|nr:hypothetical protein [Rhodobiaceae bacterium]MCC0054697.1 hypothetical protein [Rhodobiaceae bacterium]